MTNRFRTFAIAAAMLLPSVAFAQEAARPFGKGSRIASVGILTGGDYEGFGVGGSFEVGVMDLTPTLSLGIGAFAGFVRGDVGFSPTFDYTITQIPIMAIGNVHLALPSQPKLDLYGGLSLGINRYSYDYEGNAPGTFDESDSDSEVGLGIQVGARYAFTPRAMGFAQLGANDIPLLYAGFSFKF
ncbi:MAG TPA: outer membrane beta-barrel protein [Gemmatimonas sp.]|nr:outer membrane beta-barrel protein [Gemmatimonas sp.]